MADHIARPGAVPGVDARAPADVVRQVVVAISAVIAVVGLAVGVGAFGGTPVAQTDSALSADATLVAPAGPAFSIWTPIYAGLVALAVWQLAPSRRSDPRQRRVGWLVAAGMVLNAGWILTVQTGSVGWSAAVIVVLLVALAGAYGRLVTGRPSTRVEAVLLDGTVGLYLGWVSVATIANIAAAFVDAGASDLVLGERVWALLLLTAAGGVGIGVAVLGHGRLAYATALTWGLAWIAVGRTGGNRDVVVAAAAAVAAVVVVVATLLARRRRDAVSQRDPALLDGSGSR